jgi:hypothetical protein
MVRMGRTGKPSKSLGGCNCRKGKAYVFAGRLIRNVEASGQIPIPALSRKSGELCQGKDRERGKVRGRTEPRDLL